MLFLIFSSMSYQIERPVPWAAPLIPPAASMAPIWRDAAVAVRRLAAEVHRVVHDLAAFHRPDVWRGAVATRFGDDLERWRVRLGSLGAPAGGSDLVGELLALADRLDARAASAEGSTTAPDPSWWGWRGGG
jgi:hypothetical protein